MEIKLVELFIDDTVSLASIQTVLEKSFSVKSTTKENTLFITPLKTINTVSSEKQLLLYNFKTRDLEVLKLLSEGNNYDQISKKLDMTINGVRYYIKKLYKKLDVDNARKAIIEFQKLNLNLELID